MSDISDQATEAEQLHRDCAMQHRKYEHLQPKGSCHNCHESLSRPKLFCDKDCGTDYDRRKFLCA